MRKRADVLKGIALRLSSIYRLTGGKGKACREAIEITPQLRESDWRQIFENVVGLEAQRRRA